MDNSLGLFILLGLCLAAFVLGAAWGDGIGQDIKQDLIYTHCLELEYKMAECKKLMETK